MYDKQTPTGTTLFVNELYEGETIEQKISRIVNNKEPITDGAPLIYTERKQGVQPGYNIRTDRWEVAIDAMDAVTATKKAKREMRIGDEAFDNMTIEQKTEYKKKFPMSEKSKGWNPDQQPK